ncbi:hypothetical protein B5M47_01450 [candidate division CPR3 bacterium 4484_211]|uniref:Uncharacterized protein n=1 Tax=candidate division CPR3 bacterium 4484_211 TaxID=1968527 RepID=A0A1W9P086_UNCC3|nr:MAG: hypothetical protein B5M47_01450 [candidate division CPR3 bacterium 4484_211]
MTALSRPNAETSTEVSPLTADHTSERGVLTEKEAHYIWNRCASARNQARYLIEHIFNVGSAYLENKDPARQIKDSIYNKYELVAIVGNRPVKLTFFRENPDQPQGGHRMIIEFGKIEKFPASDTQADFAEINQSGTLGLEWPSKLDPESFQRSPFHLLFKRSKEPFVDMTYDKIQFQGISGDKLSQWVREVLTLIREAIGDDITSHKSGLISYRAFAKEINQEKPPSGRRQRTPRIASPIRVPFAT